MSWHALLVTPEGVLVETNNKGERRERKLTLDEARDLHMRANANGSRDPDAPSVPDISDAELHATLTATFDSQGLRPETKADRRRRLERELEELTAE